MINLVINDKAVQVKEGTTIFEAAKQNHILIPHFCYLENIHKIGSCRICVVEVEGAKNLMASCVTVATEGMVVHTNSERVRNARKVIYELMLSDHPKNCLTCWRNQNCELQELGNLIQVDDIDMKGQNPKTLLTIQVRQSFAIVQSVFFVADVSRSVIRFRGLV
jgi:NAD(P)-dependent iron-only hydrogenase catalytic subunit